MDNSYLWLKVVHLLAVVSWMAGLFYLPRLFVYHVEQKTVAGLPSVFITMERRLLAAIMRPAAVVTVVSGFLLIRWGEWYGPVPMWLWMKIALVAGMLLFHGLLERHALLLRLAREAGSGRYFRIINEIPTILLIGIVSLVVVKPV